MALDKTGEMVACGLTEGAGVGTLTLGFGLTVCSLVELMWLDAGVFGVLEGEMGTGPVGNTFTPPDGG